MQQEPKIGIVANRKGKDDFMGIGLSYFDYFDTMGNIVIVNPLNNEIDTTIDLLVLPGGLDIDPARYGRRPRVWTQNSCIELEYFDLNVLPSYIENKTPIVGICRGFQSLNVHFGGTLYQEVGDHEYSTKNRGELVHDIGMLKDHIVEKLYDVKLPISFKTNSLHHQSISDLGDELNALYYRLLEIKEKNQTKRVIDNVEAFFHKTLPIFAVQYHPEEMGCTTFYNVASAMAEKHFYDNMDIEQIEEESEIIEQ